MILDDENFRIILDLTTAVWLLGWAIGGLRNIVSRDRHPVSFLFPTHFVLCGVPLLLDHVIGAPDYLRWPGLDIAAADGPTALVYCLYISVCPLIWWYCGRWRGTARAISRPSMRRGLPVPAFLAGEDCPASGARAARSPRFGWLPIQWFTASMRR